MPKEFHLSYLLGHFKFRTNELFFSGLPDGSLIKLLATKSSGVKFIPGTNMIEENQHL